MAKVVALMELVGLVEDSVVMAAQVATAACRGTALAVGCSLCTSAGSLKAGQCPHRWYTPDRAVQTTSTRTSPNQPLRSTSPHSSCRRQRTYPAATLGRTLTSLVVLMSNSLDSAPRTKARPSDRRQLAHTMSPLCSRAGPGMDSLASSSGACIHRAPQIALGLATVRRFPARVVMAASATSQTYSADTSSAHSACVVLAPLRMCPCSGHPSTSCSYSSGLLSHRSASGCSRSGPRSQRLCHKSSHPSRSTAVADAGGMCCRRDGTYGAAQGSGRSHGWR